MTRHGQGESQGWTQAGRCTGWGHRGSGLSQHSEPWTSPSGSSGCRWALQDLIPSVGWALTEVQGGACVRGAEPDQGQQDEAGSQKQGQEVEQQQEAKEGEVGLDTGAKEAYEERSRSFRAAPSQGPTENPRADQPSRVWVTSPAWNSNHWPSPGGSPSSPSNSHQGVLSPA